MTRLRILTLLALGLTIAVVVASIGNRGNADQQNPDKKKVP